MLRCAVSYNGFDFNNFYVTDTFNIFIEFCFLGWTKASVGKKTPKEIWEACDSFISYISIVDWKGQLFYDHLVNAIQTAAMQKPRVQEAIDKEVNLLHFVKNLTDENFPCSDAHSQDPYAFTSSAADAVDIALPNSLWIEGDSYSTIGVENRNAKQRKPKRKSTTPVKVNPSVSDEAKLADLSCNQFELDQSPRSLVIDESPILSPCSYETLHRPSENMVDIKEEIPELPATAPFSMQEMLNDADPTLKDIQTYECHLQVRNLIYYVLIPLF